MTDQVLDMMPKDWDKRPISLAYEIRNFLQSVKDADTNIDSGTDGLTGDLWVRVQGVEYFIHIRRSNSQLHRDGVPKSEWPVTMRMRDLPPMD